MTAPTTDHVRAATQEVGALLGQIIREDLYMAVAAILAFVFNLDQALASGQAQPDVEVPAGMRFDAIGLPEA